MLSEKPWKLESVARLVLAIIICWLCGGIIVGVLLHFIGKETSAARIASAIVAVLSFQGAVMILAGFFLREHGVGWNEAFGFKLQPKRAVLIGFVATVIFLPMGLGLQWLSAQALSCFGVDAVEQQMVQVLRAADSWLSPLALGLFAILLAPVAEEILFRGILYPAVKQMSSRQIALWTTSVVFGAIHLNAAAFLPLTLMALVLTWVYERTDNLLAPITTHAIFNTANFIAVYFADNFIKPPAS